MVQHLFFATVESFWSTCKSVIIALYWQDQCHMISDIWKMTAWLNANLCCRAEPKIHSKSFTWEIWIPFCLWETLSTLSIFFEGLKLLSLTAITDSFLRREYRTCWGCFEQPSTYYLFIKWNNNSWMFMDLFSFSSVYLEIGMLHGKQLSTFKKRN